MNRQKIMRYLLMKKEKEMGTKLEPYQEKFFNEMEALCNSDEEIKRQINALLNVGSVQNINQMLSGTYKEKEFTPYVEEKIIPMPRPIEYDTEVPGGSEMAMPQAETSKVLVKTASNRKAGFIDALVMALITGFVGGVATTILFILI